MLCPNCKSENSDSAKFCKKCGTALKKKTINHNDMIQSINNENTNSDNKTKYIIVALIIVVIVLAGVFAYIGFGNNTNTSDTQTVDNSNNDNVEEVQNTTVSSEPAQTTQVASTPQTTQMTIGGGSFSTGSSLSDKTYASIYVGPEHAGENVKIQIYYSRDGSSLNNGNMVAKTVDSSGYINVKSADSYKYYPDYATINIYDTSNNLLATQSVSLSPESGTQYF